MSDVEQCPRCQLYYLIADHDGCPKCAPLQAFVSQSETENPKPKFGNDIAKRRWEKATSSSDLKPIDSLHRLIADMEAGDKIEHVIVVYATAPREGEKHNGMGYYQSGPYPVSHAVGLLEYAKGVLLDYLIKE